jgi:hypothetical protein
VNQSRRIPGLPDAMEAGLAGDRLAVDPAVGDGLYFRFFF